jgi:16S rRNA (guanine527-N7)-methyltransferase
VWQLVGTTSQRLEIMLDQALAILAARGIAVPEDAAARLRTHIALIQKWNRVAGFVSSQDVGRLEEHVVDSLSLAPYLNDYRDGLWLDIGSGGGFPAIPVALIVRTARLIMVERSEKKAGLLKAMVAKLALPDTVVACGNFPGVPLAQPPSVITARAVEQPTRLAPDLAPLIEGGAVFLCQTKPAWWEKALFHVEQLQDRFSEEGLRRAELYRITRAAPA